MYIKTETKVGAFVVTALGVLAYIIFFLGGTRLLKSNYKRYCAYFGQVAGLTERSEVKLAGVKVGWIDSIELQKSDGRVLISFWVKDVYQLHKDAYALIRQEGLLGAKYLEVTPGDSRLPLIEADEVFRNPGQSTMPFDSVMPQIKTATDDLCQTCQSIARVMNGPEQTERLIKMVRDISDAAASIAHMAKQLDRSVGQQTNNLTQLMTDVREVVVQLREGVPQVRASADQLMRRIDQEILPALCQTAEKAATQFDKTACQVQEAVGQASKGIACLTSVSEKIDRGQGVLGKLVCDEKLCEQMCHLSEKVKNNVELLNNLSVVTDVRGLAMLNCDHEYGHHNGMGYFGLRVYPRPDVFCGLQVVTSQKGWANRESLCQRNFDNDCKAVDPEPIVVDGSGRIVYAPRSEVIAIKRNDWRLDAQVGKTFGPLVVRAGLFEGTLGTAIDWLVPLPSETLKWVTSLQFYDFYGRNHVCYGCAPHMRWDNAITFKNIYLTFGADDMANSRSASAFIGAGICLGQ